MMRYNISFEISQHRAPTANDVFDVWILLHTDAHCCIHLHQRQHPPGHVHQRIAGDVERLQEVRPRGVGEAALKLKRGEVALAFNGKRIVAVDQAEPIQMEKQKPSRKRKSRHQTAAEAAD